jgi:hypothetical protein
MRNRFAVGLTFYFIFTICWRSPLLWFSFNFFIPAGSIWEFNKIHGGILSLMLSSRNDDFLALNNELIDFLNNKYITLAMMMSFHLSILIF